MKTSVRHFFGSTFHGLDRFKMNVNFRENKKEQLSTCFGTLISLLIFAIVLFHGKHRFEAMVNYEDYKYQKTREPIKGDSIIFDG